MDKTRFLDDLQARMAALLADTPAADVQKNLKALLSQQFSRLELVTRDELDVQARVLARTREKLEALEARVAVLEGGRAASAAAVGSGTAGSGTAGSGTAGSGTTAPQRVAE